MTRLAILAKLAAMMLLGARPGSTLRSDLRSDQKKTLATQEVQAQVQQSPVRDLVANTGLTEFAVYGINESEWKIPTANLKESGIDVDTILTRDLSNGNLQESRAAWKVEYNGASAPSLQMVEKPQATESVPLLHRWKTTELSPRDLQLALAVGVLLILVIGVAVYLYKAAGGTWGVRYADLSKSEATENDHLLPSSSAAKEAERAADTAKKIEARLARFDERLLAHANKLKDGSDSEASSTVSSTPGVPRQPWAAGR